jgi:hypothetical protein
VKNRGKYSGPVNRNIVDIIPDMQKQEFIYNLVWQKGEKE